MGNQKRTVITGVGGCIAPRPLRTIEKTGNWRINATNPSISVGKLNQYSCDISFFREFERFDRYPEKIERSSNDGRVYYIFIGLPNCFNDAYIGFYNDFTNLHTLLYRYIPAGNEFGVNGASASIQLTHQISNTASFGKTMHSLVLME